jgi:SAM-dependent methyltransferase
VANEAQKTIDRSNAAFWDTLCGSNLAAAAGITGREPDDLRRFDELYLSRYPYLARYLPAGFAGKRVLEIGLGFGTLGQVIAERGADYHGADIAAAPVAMMRQRLEWLGLPAEGVRQASVLDLPWENETFDYVYTIGCLHHTGDLQRSVDEVYRVLKPDGRAVVMLYNKHSFRRIALRLRDRLKGVSAKESEAAFRRLYDADSEGAAAPHTDFVSRKDVRELFRSFARVRTDSQNFDGFRYGIKREWFLGNVARVAGLDLYITADK